MCGFEVVQETHGCSSSFSEDFDGSERLAAVLGADIVASLAQRRGKGPDPPRDRSESKVSTFDNPELTTLGTCKKIEEIMIGDGPSVFCQFPEPVGG